MIPKKGEKLFPKCKDVTPCPRCSDGTWTPKGGGGGGKNINFSATNPARGGGWNVFISNKKRNCVLGGAPERRDRITTKSYYRSALRAKQRHTKGRPRFIGGGEKGQPSRRRIVGSRRRKDSKDEAINLAELRIVQRSLGRRKKKKNDCRD